VSVGQVLFSVLAHVPQRLPEKKFPAVPMPVSHTTKKDALKELNNHFECM